MNLYQLRYFLEVARELSFTRAAENLHISAPAVSRSVALLERSLKRRLFNRTKRHVVLTAEGAALKASAERIYDEIERARLWIEGRREECPPVLKIGSREMITNYLLTKPLAELRRRFPSARFGVYELDPKEMAQALKKDQIELGFYYSPDFQDPELEVSYLGRLDSHIYAAKSLLAGKPAPKSLDAVLRLPFAAPRYFHSDPTAPSIDGFPDQSRARDIRFEAEFMETHRRFVLDGLCAAVLPDLVVRKDAARRKVVRLKGPRLFREIYLVRRRSRPSNQAVRILRDGVREIIAGLKPA